ncbi:VOC family protein [Nocardioides sp. DS6]|uniref:VOC family protein n=1 Tax=Nocardioides eburneus TaxID=3231482 RepID=A0ABV3STB1_9ACTN
MTHILNPYLSFGGNAREAFEFYQGVFGGDLTLNTYGSMGQGGGAGADPDRIMHGQLTTPAGLVLMGADSPSGEEMPATSRIMISLSGDDADALKGYWDKLSDAGTVAMPLAPQAWGDEFGMLTDPFGIDWMVDIAVGQEG